MSQQVVQYTVDGAVRAGEPMLDRTVRRGRQRYPGAETRMPVRTAAVSSHFISDPLSSSGISVVPALNVTFIYASARNFVRTTTIQLQRRSSQSGLAVSW